MFQRASVSASGIWAQAIATGQLIALEYTPARRAVRTGTMRALRQRIPAVAALFQPEFVRHQRLAAHRAGHLAHLGVTAPGVLLHIAVEHLKPAVIARSRAETGLQGLFLGGVGSKARPQVQQTADIRRIQRIRQCIVEGALHGDAHAGDDAFQRHTLALLAGMLPQKDLLQIIPDRRAGFVDVAQEQVLLQHRHIVHAPLGKLGVRAAPLHKAAQALHDGFTPVQVGLGQAGDLGNVVLQFAEDAGAQMNRKGIQHIGVLVDLHCTDLHDLAPQSLLHTVIVEGIRLVADIPFQIK